MMIVSLTNSVADGAPFKSSQTYCLLDSKRSQIPFTLLVACLTHMKLFTGFYERYFGEKLLAEKLVKTWNFVFIKASF